MQRIAVAFTAVAALLVVGGCVSKGKYNTLKKKLEDTEALLAERQDKVVSLQEALEQEEKKLEKLEGEIASVKEELEQKSTRNEELQGELTAVVKDRARLKDSAENLQKALAELEKRKAEAEKRVSQYRDLLSKFKELIDAGKLRVKIARGRMVLELPTDVLFPSGSAELSDDGETAVVEITGVLATISDREFQVEGHTDNVPIKTRRFPSNWELASARALNVVRTMVEAGMDPERLSAASFGEHRPVASNDTEDGRARNRRIEIVIVPDLSKLPGFEELNRAVEGA